MPKFARNLFTFNRLWFRVSSMVTRNHRERGGRFCIRWITKGTRLMFEQCRLEKVSCPKLNTAVDLYRVTVRFSIISTLCRFMTASYFIGGYRRSRIYSVHDRAPRFAAFVSKRSRTRFFSPLSYRLLASSYSHQQKIPTRHLCILNCVKLSIRANIYIYMCVEIYNLRLSM